MINRLRRSCTPAYVFTHSVSYNLLYALFIFEQARLFVDAYVCFLYCMLLFCVMFIVDYSKPPVPVLFPGKLTQIDLSCVGVT